MMNRIFCVCGLALLSVYSFAQDEHGFPYGKVTYKELAITKYEKDTLADAYYLNEFGEAYMDDGGNYNLIFNYHAKIKILKKSGLKYADIEIPLWKQDGRNEFIRSIKASAYSVENGTIREIQLDTKNVFTENHKYYDLKKIAIPNVKEGSVIEFQYVLESPFVYKFRNWEFQSDIPKVYSEYWARIPANYIYNVTLRGFLELSKKESELIENCYAPGGGNRADCALYKYAMRDIPAFVEEDFMTAKSNFLSKINFELSEIRYFDGRVDKITKEWKDAELELRRNPEFGGQIRRGKDIVDEHVDLVSAGESDPYKKAKKIYNFIRDWFQWDETFGKYSALGIKKAFDQKKGNVGDINLSLVAALRYAGLNVEPVILSTRENGVPIEIHPVLSDFNYVVAKVNIGDKFYLADATDDFHPFGVLPERCLNGKGRVLGEEESYWIDLKPSDRAKRVSILNVSLNSEGEITGKIQSTYLGYEGINQRKRIYSFNTPKEYIDDFGHKLDNLEIESFELLNVEDEDKPLVQKLQVRIRAFDHSLADNFLFNPFIIGKWEGNPFKSNERLYPVDFGTPREYVTILNMEYPHEFEIVNAPEKTGLLLPASGGRYVFDVQNIGNKITLNNSLTISRTLYSSSEYHYLKELFNRIIQIQNTDLLFKKKA